MTTPDPLNAWMAGHDLEGVQFRLNDAVEVVNGAEVGARGSVISLETLTDDPTYLVELSDGTDRTFPQSALRAIPGPPA